MPVPTITCPHCSQPISVDEALSHQISAKMEAEFKAKLSAKDQEISKVRAATAAAIKQELEAEKAKAFKAAQEEATQAIATAKAESAKAIAQAQEEATKAISKELAFLKEQLQTKDKKLEEAQEQELTLRKKQTQLEDEKKAFELEKLRQLDAERAKIREEAEKKALESQDLKMMEKDKKLADLEKQLRDAQMKLQQGSQQTQGEVLELELENLLKTEFPIDEIQPVAKGIRGADVLQVVKDRQGRTCGTILWELKNAQWSDKWLEKLREDQRTSRADLAVLVSINLPLTIKTFGYQKGIWVTSRSLCTALASALRFQLYQVATTKLAAVGKNEKMEVLYGYLSGNEFKQRVEAIVEAFTSLQEDLEIEKRWYQKKWSKQEKNIRKVIDHTMGMHGDLQSIMGASLPEIKQLQLESGEESEAERETTQTTLL